MKVASATPQKPNIICLPGGDVGIGDIACSVSDHYRTPSVDALARGGIRFTHATDSTWTG